MNDTSNASMGASQQAWDMTGTNIAPDPRRTWCHKLRNQWDKYRGCAGAAITSTTASHSGCVIVSALSGLGAGGASPLIVPMFGETPMKIVFNFAIAPVMAAVLTPVFEKATGNDFSLNPRNKDFIFKKSLQRFSENEFSLNPLCTNFLLRVGPQDYSLKKGLTAVFISLALASASHLSAPYLSQWTQNQYKYDWEDRSRALVAYVFSLSAEEKAEARRLAGQNDGIANAVLFLRPDICKTR